MVHCLANAGMLNDGVTFNLCSEKVCSPAIFETFLL